MRTALSWVQARRTRLLVAVLLSVVVCLVLWKTVHAATNIVDEVLLLIAKFVQWIMQLVGAIVLFLVSYLIKAAQYNNFVKAYPVVTGWVLVRDTVNMFFIVILLVVAFSNIVGYRVNEFGAKAVLPKLLMMAVLINFSKTIVGVMIDFSQVVMLTFVNGFQAAAGGNFINALKLTKVSDLSKQQLGAGQTGISDILIASILGLGMLSISALVILCMLAYLLMRIVGLWITLIFAPIAFFALALPGKLQSALGTFTGEWWKRLSALLVGGPIVAFFLWLSLATVQGGQSTFSDVYPAGTKDESSAMSVGISKAGEPADLASFIIAIVMLLLGLNAAIASARSVSAEGWGAIQKAKGIAIKGAAATAKFGARKGIGAGKAVARGIDTKYDLTGRLGANLGKKAEAMAKGGGLLGTLVAPSLARAGAKASAIPAARRKAKGEALSKAAEGLSPEGRMRYFETMGAAHEGSIFGDKEVAAAAKERSLAIATSRPGKGIAKNAAIGEYYKQHGIDPKSATGPQKDAAKNYGEGKANRVMADRMDELKALYEKQGKMDELGKLEEEQMKNPALNNDIKGMSEGMAKKDYQETLKTMKADALSDSATAASVAKSFGFLDANGKPLPMDAIKQTDQWQKLAKSPARAKAMENQLNNFSGAGAGVLAAHLADMGGGASSAAQRYHMGPDGSVYTVGAGATPSMTPVAAPAAPAPMSFSQLTSSLPPANATSFQTSMAGAGVNTASMAQRFSAPITPEAAAAMSSAANVYGAAPPAHYTDANRASMGAAQTHGVPSSVAFNVDSNTGSYRSPEDEYSHSMNYQKAATNLGSEDVNESRNAVSFIANTDTAAFEKGGAMTDVVVQNLQGKLKDLAGALSHAKTEDRQRIEAFAKAVRSHAEQVMNQKTALSDAQKRLIDLNKEMAKVATLNRMAGKS